MNISISPSDDMVFPASQISDAVSTSILFFKTLHIPTSVEERAHAVIDGYIRASLAGLAGPIQGLGMFAPSHSGKSTLISSYSVTRVVPAMIRRDPTLAAVPVQNLVARQKTVLHVTLSEDSTPRSVAVDILKKLNPALPVSGSKETLWHRVYEQCALFGVRLLVLDEIQHLAATGMTFENGEVVKIDLRRSRSTPDALKIILERGSIPTMFVGIEKARKLLIGSTQFNGRISEIALPALNWTIDEDRMEFLKFAGRIAKAMHEAGVVKKLPRLVYDDTPRLLFIASKGRFGLLCKILLQSLVIALSESDRELSTEHLRQAVDIVCVSRGELSENPFRHTGAALELA